MNNECKYIAKPVTKQIKDSRDALDFFETVSLPAGALCAQWHENAVKSMFGDN